MELYYLKLVPFIVDKVSTCKTDYMVEIRRVKDDFLHADFGSSFVRSSEELTLQVAKILNTLEISTITKIQKDSTLKKVDLSIVEIKRAMKTGTKLEFAELDRYKIDNKKNKSFPIS